MIQTWDAGGWPRAAARSREEKKGRYSDPGSGVKLTQRLEGRKMEGRKRAGDCAKIKGLGVGETSAHGDVFHNGAAIRSRGWRNQTDTATTRKRDVYTQAMVRYKGMMRYWSRTFGNIRMTSS